MSPATLPPHPQKRLQSALLLLLLRSRRRPPSSSSSPQQMTARPNSSSTSSGRRPIMTCWLMFDCGCGPGRVSARFDFAWLSMMIRPLLVMGRTHDRLLLLCWTSPRGSTCLRNLVSNRTPKKEKNTIRYRRASLDLVSFFHLNQSDVPSAAPVRSLHTHSTTRAYERAARAVGKTPRRRSVDAAGICRR